MIAREPRQINLAQADDEQPVLPTVYEEPAAVPAVTLAEGMATEIRRIYVGCYQETQGTTSYGREPIPQWDGGEDAFGRRHKPIWPKIARVILENNADPISFIRAQFWGRRGDNRPPAPNYLLSAPALARYRVYQQQAATDARQEYAAGLLAVRGEVLLLTSGLSWDYRRALRYALLNVIAVRASALFRYCLAATEGLDDVRENYRDRALMQYVFRKDAYDAAWGDKIPPHLRQEGETLRRSVLGGR